MFKHVSALTIVTILVLGAMAAHATEGHRGLWWRSPETASRLQLTDSEIEQLESAFESYRLKMIELKSQVESEQFKLQTLLERPQLDEAAAWAQHEDLEKARTVLANERFAFFVQVRKIIGHERFKALMELRAARLDRKRR